MIKLNRKMVISIALIAITILSMATPVRAVENPEKYTPSQEIEEGVFIQRASSILGYIQVVGMIVAVIGIAIIGLKYMFSSIEGKAEYKKTMFPYVVGCFMLMATSTIIGVIKAVAKI